MATRTLTCRQCGKPFTAERKPGQPPACCGSACRQERHRVKLREARARAATHRERVRSSPVALADGITPVQREYLRAFDRWLRTGATVHEQAKDCLLDGIFWERGFLPPSLRPDRHDLTADYQV